MSTPIYSWKRFWCPRTGQISLADGGYLTDPKAEWGHVYNLDVVSFEAIANTPCLVFLGEPGIGKSHAMQAERDAIDSRIRVEGGETLWFDLRAYGSEERLVRGLFANPVFESWARGRHALHLFLDSLDECLLRIDNLGILLTDELKKYPTDRLYARIACRSADLPRTLEDGLRRLWGQEAVGVYELAPLRRVDVAEAASANGLDPSAFLREIDRMGAVPLAIKPVTLNFLINVYRRSSSFPSTQAELYLEGCRRLCEETSESRRDAGRVGALSADQRLAIAARIAAVMIFANRYAIWTGIDLGDVPEEDVAVRELCGGREGDEDVPIEVTDGAVREVLGTGLFSCRGEDRMGWAHQTYAEFLGARYLVQRRLAVPQMMDLIVHSGDPEEKLVPQLHETAAWLSGMMPQVFQEVMQRDPEVLLRSDVATAEPEEQARLVKSLLRLYAEEKLLDRDWDLRRGYRKLVHPNLAAQLGPYISDVRQGLVVRRVAIQIAEACDVKALQEDLVGIALDGSQPHAIRVNAAYATGRIGDPLVVARLAPLAIGEAENDPDDELKGCALEALWPTHLTAEEVFRLLNPPKDEALIGAYRMFVRDHLVQNLKPSDLPAALRWVEVRPLRHELPHPFEKLVDSIMAKAWEHLDAFGVFDAFARAALSRLRHLEAIVDERHSPEFRSALIGEDEKRRKIVERIVPLLSEPAKDAIDLVFARPPLVLSKDLPWLVERLRAAESGKDRDAWGHLIMRSFDWQDAGHLRVVVGARARHRLLADAFPRLKLFVALHCPALLRLAGRLRKTRFGERTRKRVVLKPPPAERIRRSLRECESGNSAAWWRLNLEMTLEPDSTHYGDELEADLTVHPGWKAADPATRLRIIRAAKRYLIEQDPATQKWLGTNIWHRPAWAGYRALRLLFQEIPSEFSALTVEVWRKWASVVLAFPERVEAVRRKLVAEAYQYAPADILEALMVLIDKDNRDYSDVSDHSDISIVRAVEGCWDDQLGNRLMLKVGDDHLTPSSMGSLLSVLLEHKVAQANSFAESLILPGLPPRGDVGRARAIVAARALLIHADDAGWATIWPVMQTDREFGSEVVSALAETSSRGAERWPQRLTEHQLADLYVWLVRQYPYADDVTQAGAHWVGSRERVGMWRDSILQHLKGRGTPAGCEAIRRIGREFPELDWLKWTLADAQDLARRRNWMPARPRDVLQLAGDQEKRLVQSGEQLVEVLLESLKRLEAKLQGETPAAIDVWNEIGKAAYRPKDENRLSDYVKRYLENDVGVRGIIVNREVEIRRGAGSIGERTDIHVDAVVRSSSGEVFDSITAIIEVKGCWHPELYHAMETQLVNRYLKDNRCQQGLYLVGWFNCDQWDPSDERSKRAPQISRDEAQQRFDAQAADLSAAGPYVRALVLNTAIR